MQDSGKLYIGQTLVHGPISTAGSIFNQPWINVLSYSGSPWRLTRPHIYITASSYYCYLLVLHRSVVLTYLFNIFKSNASRNIHRSMYLQHEWMNEWMNDVSSHSHSHSHNSALECYTRPVTTWANEMNFGRTHAPGAGSIAQPVDLQSSSLLLYHASPTPPNISKYLR